MSVSNGHEPDQKTSFRLGLLYFAHLLVMTDGEVDHREEAAIRKIKLQENIPDWIFDDFQESILSQTEQQIFKKGVEMLNRCSEEEKLTAFVHLYRLTEVDNSVHRKEVRFLLYSLKATNVAFEDVELNAKLDKVVSVKR
jgi:pterin-4a-carbinolamine dehydratase